MIVENQKPEDYATFCAYGVRKSESDLMNHVVEEMCCVHDDLLCILAAIEDGAYDHL